MMCFLLTSSIIPDLRPNPKVFSFISRQQISYNYFYFGPHYNCYMSSPGRGRGGGATGQQQLRAEDLSGQPAQSFYMRQYRTDVQEQILQSDPELRRRVEEEEADGCCYNYEASDELWNKATIILGQQFAQLSPEKKMPYEKDALESKYNQWRTFRNMGSLIESEESLAQKQKDEKLGITGPVGGGGKGKGQGKAIPASSQHQQVTGTFIGGELLTPLQELTPPFNRNTLKMKTGKINAEEYF